MPETLFDPTNHEPRTASQAADLLYRAGEHLRDLRGHALYPKLHIQEWLAVMDAQLTLSVLAYSLEHPSWVPADGWERYCGSDDLGCRPELDTIT